MRVAPGDYAFPGTHCVVDVLREFHAQNNRAAILGMRVNYVSFPLQFCHTAYHLQVPLGEQPHRQAHHPLRAACRGHDQHGRHGALRGRGSHLYRPSEQLRVGLWTDHHHQVRLLL